MAKAKTPSTGDTEPTQPSTSRASSASTKAKTTVSNTATAKPAKASVESKARKTKASPATSAEEAKPAVTTAASKTPQDVTTSGAPQPGAKTDDALPKETTTSGSMKPAETSETKAKVETGTIDKDAGSTPDPVKADAPKPSESKPSSSTPAAKANTPPSAQKSDQKKGSVFFPMVLGGIVAAGIGFAAAELDLLGLRTDTNGDDQFQATLSEQADRIAALEGASGADPTPAEPDPRIEELLASVSDLTARVEDLSNRPTDAEAPPPVDTSAFEEELAALKSSVETQRDEIRGLLDNALSVEEATAEAAQAATVQSALARIVAAITTGQPFAQDTAELQANGVSDIPPALSDTAETGVVTAANLQDRFPEAARAALGAARADASSQSGGGFGDFLKTQLGARSVTPREGTDPDAVLSRSEAAVRDGRLDDALTEIDALPDRAKAPLADWLADARARQAAQDAVDTLTQRLTAS